MSWLVPPTYNSFETLGGKHQKPAGVEEVGEGQPPVLDPRVAKQSIRRKNRKLSEKTKNLRAPYEDEKNKASLRYAPTLRRRSGGGGFHCREDKKRPRQSKEESETTL